MAHTACIYAPEEQQKQVANIFSRSKESGKLTEQDMAILAEFNDWWENVGKAKYPLEEGQSIYDEGVLQNHPQKDTIIADFKNRSRNNEINTSFLEKKRSDMRNVILDFPSAEKMHDAYEAVAFYINEVVANILQDADANTEKPSLESLKDKVRESILAENKLLEAELLRIEGDETKAKKAEKLRTILDQRNLLYKDIDGLYPSAIALYKMNYADITQVARINDSNTPVEDEENEDTQRSSSNQEDFSTKDSYEDTFGKLGVESWANSLVKQLMTQMVFMDKNGKVLRNSLNVRKKVPSARVFGQLATWLANIKTQDEMMERLKKRSEAPEGYWLKGLLETLESSSKAADLKNALFVTFNKSTVNYAINVIGNNNRILLKNFLKSDSETVISAAWKFQVMETMAFDELESPTKKTTIYTKDKNDAYHNITTAQEKFADLLKDHYTPVDEREDEYKEALKNLFSTIGINLTDEVLGMIVEYDPTLHEDYVLGRNADDNRKKLLSAINTIFGKIAKYVVKNNLNSTKEFEYSDMRQYVEELAKEIGSKMLLEVQRSTKIGKDIMYNTVNNSFILTQKKFLFGDEYYNEWILPYYMQDPWYNRAKTSNDDATEFKPYIPILADIDRGMGKNYTRVIVRKDANDKEYSEMSREDILISEWAGFLTEYSSATENKLSSFWGWFKDGLFGDSSKFMFMRMPVYSLNEIREHLTNIVYQEYRRICRTEAILEARKQGKVIRITAAEAKNGVKFNFFPALNKLQFYRNDIDKRLGIESKSPSNEKISFKEALDILRQNSTEFKNFISEALYRENPNGTTAGVLVDTIKEDREVILNSNKDEFTVSSVRAMDAYNKKYGFNASGMPLFSYKDGNGVPYVPTNSKRTSVEELKLYKRIATGEINKLKALLSEDKNNETLKGQIYGLENIVKKLNTDIERNLYDNVDRFLYNRVLHSIQLLELRDKDLAYFKNFNDYIKRSKQAAGDYISPNIDAPVHNRKSAEKILILNDASYTIDKDTYDTICNNLDKAVSQGKITKRAAQYLKNVWGGEITATDGQMMRTMISKRDLDIMLALPESTGIVNKIYGTVISDSNPTDEMLNNASKLVSNMKEFCYSMPEANNYAPTQLKNGTISLNSSVKNGGIFANAPKLRALQRFAEENGYDAIVFASGMKVGLPVSSDIIDININTEGMSRGEIETAFYNHLKDQAIKKPLSTIDGIEFKFLGEQTKERNYDAENASMNIGTQLTKIIPSILKNISGTVKIGKQDLSGKQAFTLYQAAAVLEKIDDWNRAKKVFTDKKSLNQKLKGGIEASKKFKSELIEGLETDENDNPLIPYNDITVRSVFEDKLLAFGRKTLSKILASSLGDHLYTASDFGFEGSDRLHMVYGEDGNLKYVECYLPLIYEELLEGCLVSDNGGKTFSLDKKLLYEKYKNNKKLLSRIEELFNIVGYRVPTEGMCSIIPLRIKGFLPLTHQGNIILPAEMIKRTGHDMDGDEIFILKRASREYTKNSFIRDMGLENASQEEQDKTWEEVKDIYENTPINVRYNITDRLAKALEENDFETIYEEMSSMSEGEMHNLLVDLIFSTGVTEEGTLDGIRISSFEDINRNSKLIKYIDHLNLNSKNVEQEINRVEKLLDEDSSKLSKMVDELSENDTNPMSLKTSLDATEEALAGKKFLGIFAVGKAVGAITLTTNTTIINGPYINGKQLKDLSIPIHSNAESVAANIAQAVAACPDNSKDPTVTAFGVNDLTKNVIQLLIQGGFDLQTICLLMNQPIIRQLSSRVLGGESENPSPSSVNAALSDILSGLSKKLGTEIKITDEVKKKATDGSIDTSIKSLLSNIMKNKANAESASDLLNQAYIGVLFNELYKISSVYSNRSRCLRGDSASGSLGTSIEESLKRVSTVETYDAQTKDKNFPISESFPIVDVSYTPSKYDSDKEIFSKIMMSSFPLSYAQYAIGIKGFLGLMSEIYPEINPMWKAALFKTANYSKNNFKINDLYTFVWHKNLQRDPSQSKAKIMVDTIVTMPTKIQRLKDDPKYKNNPLLKDLGFKYRAIGNTGVQIPVIESSTTSSSGRLSNAKLQDVIDGWKRLGEDDDPYVRGVARQLFMYFLYVYGNTWKPGSLAFCRPNNIVLSIANYRNSLESISRAPSEEMANNYDRQSLLNHLDIYAKNLPSTALDKLGIDDASTVEEIRSKAPFETDRGLPIIKIKGSDGVVYLEDDGTATAGKSNYRELKPVNISLDGLNIVNMDSTLESKDLPDIQSMLLKRAAEAKVTTKEGQKAVEDFQAAQEADEYAWQQEAPSYDNYFTNISEEELLQNESFTSYPVANLDENKDESGNIVDSENNKKC